MARISQYVATYSRPTPMGPNSPPHPHPTHSHGDRTQRPQYPNQQHPSRILYASHHTTTVRPRLYLLWILRTQMDAATRPVPLSTEPSAPPQPSRHSYTYSLLRPTPTGTVHMAHSQHAPSWHGPATTTIIRSLASFDPNPRTI